MGAYFERNQRRFITGARIITLFHTIAKEVYPDISKKEMSKFSSHAIRVTAAVLLQIADKPGHFIQQRLRWEGDSYRLYLRNTSVLAQSHLQAHRASNAMATSYHLAAANVDMNSNVLNSNTVPPQHTVEEYGTYTEF